jgi:hypothetical protein
VRSSLCKKILVVMKHSNLSNTWDWYCHLVGDRASLHERFCIFQYDRWLLTLNWTLWEGESLFYDQKNVSFEGRQNIISFEHFFKDENVGVILKCYRFASG